MCRSRIIVVGQRRGEVLRPFPAAKGVAGVGPAVDIRSDGEFAVLFYNVNRFVNDGNEVAHGKSLG